MSRCLPLWDDSDPLALLFTVLFGAYPAGDRGEELRAAFGQDAEPFRIPPDGPFPVLPDGVATPATITGNRLVYSGEDHGVAVVMVGDDPRDLVGLWNLQATGRLVFPWPISCGERFEQALTFWLRSDAVQQSAGVYMTGDRKESGRLVSLVHNRNPANDEVRHVVELVERPGWRVSHGSVDFLGGWTGGRHPLQTDYGRSFDVLAGEEDWNVTISLPTLGVRRSRREDHWPGYVVADIEITREIGFPPGRSFSVPSLRRLSPLLHRLGDETAPMRRATGDGRVVAVQADAATMSLGLMPVWALFEEIFNVPGWTLKPSDDGRFATQLIERLGGAGAATDSQPAVRAVLHLAANQAATSGRAHPIARYIHEAEVRRGAWPDALSGQSPRKYANNVVYWLLRQGILRAALHVICPECATDTYLRPDDLHAEFQCPLCSTQMPLGFALATCKSTSSPWAYQLSAAVPPDRIRSALPAMAGLTVLRGHQLGLAPTSLHVLGVEINAGGWDCELDIAMAILDQLNTTIVVGEVKSYRDDIDAKDVENLEQVQSSLQDIGLDTVVLFATTRPKMSDSERTLLRSLCERAPRRVSRVGRVELALPIVLTHDDPSMPWFDDRHPWRWRGAGAFPLSGLATESCRRNLGLARVDMAAVDGQWLPRPVWADEPGSQQTSE